MSTVLAPSRAMLSLQCSRFTARAAPTTYRRALSTLPSNKHIYIHEQPSTPKSYIVSFLPTTPPTPSLAIGTSTTNPPTPESLKENPDFFQILHQVLKENAACDPEVQAAAATYASQAGSALGSGGVFFPQQKQRKRRLSKSQLAGGGGGAGGDGAGGASSQGGMGGAGKGGYIHVSDQRNPPDFGRVAWPEDIFGSLEVDGQGAFVDGHGRYQVAGTYRACTNEGVLVLSPFLREKVVERLQQLEEQVRKCS